MELQSVTSPEIVTEWRKTMISVSVLEYFGRRDVPSIRLNRLIEDMIAACEITHPEGDPPPCRDEQDRKYLHCAVSGNVDFLVTTDLDLLVQERIASTEIVRPGALWRLLFE